MLLPDNEWNSFHIRQCNDAIGQGILSDKHTLAPFQEDFGKLLHSDPAAVFEPQSIEAAQAFMCYAFENGLPVTLRGKGMSQSGQSLAVPGGLVLSMQYLNKTLELDSNSILVEANTSWSSLLDQSLSNSSVPYVVPSNCNLSIAGVISAGGVGSASGKYGSVTAHVNELEVLKANGELVKVDGANPLMQACLGGQGRFGLITKARLALRPCRKSVRTFFLLYLEKETWLKDLCKCKTNADYLESFCTPAIQGAKLSKMGRSPFAQWFYALHVSFEFDDMPPDICDLNLSPWKLLHTQDEPIRSFFHRHDERFKAMQATGQWELQHPWYECFITKAQLENLDEILEVLPIYFASAVHIAPIDPCRPHGFLQLPKDEDVFAIMILNPGLAAPLVSGCLETIKKLDEILLPGGGKRYLSGYLGVSIISEFWKRHFAERYEDWIEQKKLYDPKNILCSHLHHQGKPEQEYGAAKLKSKISSGNPMNRA